MDIVLEQFGKKPYNSNRYCLSHGNTSINNMTTTDKGGIPYNVIIHYRPVKGIVYTCLFSSKDHEIQSKSTRNFLDIIVKQSIGENTDKSMNDLTKIIDFRLL